MCFNLCGFFKEKYINSRKIVSLEQVKSFIFKVHHLALNHDNSMAYFLRVFKSILFALISFTRFSN